MPHLSKLKSYYLAGGTALALQLGHRVSVDFDFFSDKKIPTTLYSEVKKILPENIIIKPSVNNSDELTFFASDTKVTFLSYPFQLVKPLVDLNGLYLASVQELGAIKAYTIGRRGEYKDYIDLYYLLYEKQTSLKEIIELAKKKYKNDFSDRLFLEQLLYLDDVNITDITLLKQENFTKEQLKVFFERQIKSLNL
ncbi:MAG: nucleotidyl transferase AbiEii/AbiGii toxin family protein [Candidatus Melainabacteria bacterium]|nr:nucleotidyl transferase AbiEii/AbiGii toxin family protein [Candidatus Melainabacteria bacterium]